MFAIWNAALLFKSLFSVCTTLQICVHCLQAMTLMCFEQLQERAVSEILVGLDVGA
jgi:hypothetical protein